MNERDSERHTIPQLREPVILASRSPRRQELMCQCGIPFSVFVPQIKEHFDTKLTMEKAIEKLAREKCESVKQLYPERTIVGADTVVVLGEKILGKPTDRDDAFEMLTLLSGKTHRVITGVCILSPGKDVVFHQTSAVRFHALTSGEIREYIDSGEPMDKAGAYGIQGKGALLIREIRGDFYSVMGLPVSRVYRELRDIAAL